MFATLTNTQQAFEAIKYDYSDYAIETGFSTFWSHCYPAQAKLVVAYVVEAFADLKCPLESLKPGEKLPTIQYQTKHKLLVDQLYEILIDASLVSRSDSSFVRTAETIDKTSSNELLQRILQDFPQHASEHKLLHITGNRLADCLSGKADPLQLLFRSKENKDLLEDVYNGPMYAAVTKQLGSFFEKTFVNVQGKVNILELGGGTGGTTKYSLNHLTRLNVDFTYTFTDLSGSLVAAAKKKFAGYNNVEYKTMNIGKRPDQLLVGKYHVIISNNCIHATKDLTASSANILSMLRPDGFLSLVEFTRIMFWFDLVFGLLDGWWFVNDGRKHVLADESFWECSMKRAGFKHVTWTTGDSPEANTLRIITGFPKANELESQTTNVDMETIVYKETDDRIPLYADIYYPPISEIPKRELWPVGTRLSDP
jgi:SAM-dependent methyltransferase